MSTQHNDMGAVRSGGGIGGGSDIDSAVLAATNFGQGGLTQKLELSFKCTNLVNMDTFSKSDPFVVFYKQQGNMWNKLGQTEIIHDNLNPEFVQKINVDFHFEQNEKYKVQVYDSDDDKSKNLASHDFIGEYIFTLHEVVTGRDQTMTKPLTNKDRKNPGNIIVTAEEKAASQNTQIIMFNPVGQLKNNGGLCFFIIYRQISLGKFTPVFKSEVKRAQNGVFNYNQV